MASEGHPTLPYSPFNFLAMPPEESDPEKARFVVLPVPYDGTASYRGGAREGPRAILEASRYLEDFDPELGCEVSALGIYTAPEIEPHMGDPLKMAKRVEKAVAALLRPGEPHGAHSGNLVATLGGDHSISLGAVWAHKAAYPQLSVLYLDAHADLRDEYLGTRYGHASVARRISEACDLVLVGVRSLSQEEHTFIQERAIPCYYQMPEGGMAAHADRIASQLSAWVYVSVDLDVLDPSAMAAVGTPEPGGMGWWELLGLLKGVASRRRIVGFDVTELSPAHGPEACAYTAAKLVYKLMSYATLYPELEFPHR